MYYLIPLFVSGFAIFALWKANKKIQVLTKGELIFWSVMIVVFMELLWMKFF